MKWFYNMKVAHKLALSFGMCLAFACLAGVVAVERMSVLNSDTQRIIDDPLATSTILTRLGHDVLSYRSDQKSFIMARSSADMDKLSTKLADEAKHIDDDMGQYLLASTDPDDKAVYDKVAQALAAYRTFDKQIELAGRSDDKKAAEDLIDGPTQTAMDALTSEIDVSSQANVECGNDLAKSDKATFVKARLTVILLLCAALAIGALFAIFVTKIITNALSGVGVKLDSFDKVCLSNLNSSVMAMAAGDFTVEIATEPTMLEANSKDEFGDLARTLNSMICKAQETIGNFRNAQSSLSELMGNASVAANSITSTSGELASGSLDLASRTADQASSLEETAASMEEMTSIVKQNAENCRNANKLATDARDVAQHGGEIVEKAIASMGNINSSSKKISDIISVIDEIAFQTNLLALNAAVEAARVGDQGRGFAVVASEVRNLAGRSSMAAKEIKTLVQDSVQKVDEGTALVNLSGEQLRGIVDAVNSVAVIVSQISSASQEQSAGIEQVNRAVIHMDEITQQNAALVEEATAATQAMSDQAVQLQELVAKFKYDKSSVHAASVPAHSPRPSSHAPENVDLKATGTAGRPALKMVSSTHSHEDMEEF